MFFVLKLLPDFRKFFWGIFSLIRLHVWNNCCCCCFCFKGMEYGSPLNTKSDRFELDILKFNFVVDANVYYLWFFHGVVTHFFYIVDFYCEERGEQVRTVMYLCTLAVWSVVPQSLKKKRIILIEVFPIITVDFC